MLDVVTDDGPLTAFEAVPRVFGEAMTPMNANWWLSETLCYLRHLERHGPRGARAAGGAAPSAWRSLRPGCRAMRIDELLDRGDRPVFSFEFFPPKTRRASATSAARWPSSSRWSPTSCR